jgi:5-formyltetrahydrofolate cyclo-ligase
MKSLSKEELRNIFRQKRQMLSEEELTARSQDLCNQFFETIDFSNITALHCYLPITKRNEPNTWLIINRLFSAFSQIEIVVPWANEGQQMESTILKYDADLKTGKMGIHEPAVKKLVDPHKIDLMVLPLLAVDTNGFRIGYGQGYYDRYLQRCRPDMHKVALSLFEPLPVGSFTPDEWDVPADLVLSARH